jgi:stearoyl-CoA desaturase (delta-9 desaturase)
MDTAPPTGDTEPPARRDDVQPVANENLDRFITGMVSVLPFVGLFVVAWQVWNSLLSWSDLVVFAILYLICGLGVTVGFHRHLTHRAFKTSRPVRAALAIAGSMAIEGPVTSWVADHRKHHQFSDQVGDPHSPHAEHGPGLRGVLAGLAHAHMGWLFIHTGRGAHERYTPDLLKDPVIQWVHRTFVVWVVVGLALPFGLGWLIGGSIHTALTGLLWGGLVRMLVLHHSTYSINSLCHFFGRQRFKTGDESRNLAWLSIFSLGESWHNNHHAFPTSAFHGMRAWELDVSSLVIRAMQKTGLIWDVVEIPRERQAKKLAA